MKRILFPLLMLALLAPTFSSCWRKAPAAATAPVQKDTVYPLGFLTDSFSVVNGTVRNGEAFSTLMQRLGMSGGDAYSMSLLCDSVFDVRKVRAGNGVDAYYSGDSTSRRLEYVVYSNDKTRSTVFKCADSLALWQVVKPVDTLKHYVDVTISSSLWQDLQKQGESPLLIATFESVYEWTVNFFGLHEGDRFQAICHELVCEGEVIDVQGIDFAVYSRGADSLFAIRFDQGDGGNKYWNEKGESMRKAFLKAPLQYSRISSRFSYHRLHPVHHVVRAHTGVDYAAPSGTPVRALGDGTVIKAGWGGGGGNTIYIKHPNKYQTGYLHLRNFAPGIKVGKVVRQGEVIGYVGSTGTATGPHLDFRVWKNGTPIDPLAMESPSQEPLKEENMPAMRALFEEYRAELAGRKGEEEGPLPTYSISF